MNLQNHTKEFFRIYKSSRYKIDECNSGSGFVPVDSRMSVIYKEAAGLVGLDGPTEELSNWLTDSKKTVKVVSIVGFGGLGKTTLAKQLYDKVGGKFDVKAFVPISQRPNVSGILNSMQSKLGIKDSSQHKDDHDIIDGLREHLKHKRYFIVIDDLWDHLTWETVRCAFPENSNGSRIIVTTRLEDVAFAACCNNQQCIYKMKYLNDEDSKRLFFGRISGSNYPSNVEEASAGILKKCGGLPLAVITVASLLACRPEILRKDWESIRNYLDMQFGTNLTLDGVKLILNLSYIHLPLRLRACCLYLGMYPEDEEIMRDDLARQWIAEGFVGIIPGLDLEDVAKSYFNELINVSMIQPERIEYGEVLSCRVHDMMLDLIQSKCVEDNFVSVAYKYEDMARLHDCQYKVRRLLNLCTSEGTDGTISGTIIAPSMSQVRSFAQHGNAKHSPSLSLFKHLRVLVLYMEGMTVDLTAINQLFQLRYLKVSAANGSIQLPTKIKGPVHLETLELVEGDFKSTLPSDIVDLPCLSHLIVDRFHRTPDLPNGISQMKSLRTLHGFEIGRNSVEDIVGLGDLTNLRDLKLYFWRKTPETMDALSSLIGKLRNVKHLSLIGLSLGEDNMLLSISEPPLHIEVLELPYYLFSRLPKWIGDLHCLCRLQLEVGEPQIHVLGALPYLADLLLRVEKIGVIFGTGLFPVLEHLSFENVAYDTKAYLGFKAGSLPKLRRLTLKLHECNWGGATPVGIEHLLGLERINVNICGILFLRRDSSGEQIVF